MNCTNYLLLTILTTCYKSDTFVEKNIHKYNGEKHKQKWLFNKVVLLWEE